MKAIDLITRSLRLIGVLGEGETPTADQANDALQTLNDILDNWNTESLTLYGTSNDTYTATANGTGVYTIGPGGDFNDTRPTFINDAYVTYQGITYPMTLITQDEYNDITLKTLTQVIPRYMLYVPEFPLGKITIWPIPQQAMPLTISADRVLPALTLTSDIAFPPGWAKALRYTLAIDLCPEFGKEPSPTLVAIAKDAKGDIKRANHRPTVSEFDTALTNPPMGYAGFLQGY